MRVRVPASSANLGPGFDVLGAALDVHLEVDVERSPSFELVTDLPVPRDRGNLLVSSFERLLPADGWRFRVSSRIPLSGGLGSSAAAVVGGLLAADALSGGDGDVLEAAAEIEGHPDNVAAALFGGFVICGGGRPVRLSPPEGLSAVLVVPTQPVSTEQARAVLPAHVPLADAVFNVSRASLLTLGIARGDLELVRRGLGDRLHQAYRAGLFPRSAALVERAGDLGALGATVSGAGPTILVWCESGRVAEVARRCEAEAQGWAQVLSVSFAMDGARAQGV